MIPVVEQDGNLWDIDGFGSKVVQVVAQQFNQALVVGHTGFSAVSKKRQSQRIDSKMSFDAIGTFVMTEPFKFDTGIAGIFYRL